MSAPAPKKHSQERRASLRTAFGILLIFFVAGALAAGYQIYQRIVGAGPSAAAQPPVSSAEPVASYRRVLDGMVVSSTQLIAPPLVAITVDNHPDARPQAGLEHASLVYEFPVEGLFSRYLAVFSLDAPSPAPIGPVRSARPYFVTIAQELGALYAHVGGSPEALDLITSRGIRDVNEYYKGHLFWRERRGGRFAPHNVMTTTDQMEQGRIQFFPSVTSSVVASWSWSETVPAYLPTTSTATITVDWPGSENRVQWKYDAASQQYTRYRGAKEHRSEKGATILADTIIVQHIHATVLDSAGRLRIDLVGTGAAEIYRDGLRVGGTWKKDALNSRTQWLDAQGNPIPLRPGRIWVQVVSEDVPVIFAR